MASERPNSLFEALLFFAVLHISSYNKCEPGEVWRFRPGSNPDHKLELAQPIQKTAARDHVVDVLRERKRLANILDCILEKFPVRHWFML